MRPFQGWNSACSAAALDVLPPDLVSHGGTVLHLWHLDFVEYALRTKVVYKMTTVKGCSTQLQNYCLHVYRSAI